MPNWYAVSQTYELLHEIKGHNLTIVRFVKGNSILTQQSIPSHEYAKFFYKTYICMYVLSSANFDDSIHEVNSVKTYHVLCCQT